MLRRCMAAKITIRSLESLVTLGIYVVEVLEDMLSEPVY